MYDQFYDFSHPTVAFYDAKSGKLKCRFGKLPSFAKRLKTGYQFSSSTFAAHEKEFAYAIGYSGEIYISDVDYIECDDCAKYYKLFDIDEIDLPDPNEKYSFNYLNYVRENLNKEIVQVRFNDDSIFAIVRIGNDPLGRPYKNNYQLYVVDRVTHGMDIFNFPTGDGYTIQGVGLEQDESDNISAYDIIRNNDSTWKLRHLSFN